MHYLIIGGGIAGTSAAEELRKLDPKAEITIISEENHPLYSRVLLPHYVLGKVDLEKIFLKKLEWYEEKKIEFLPGTRVVQLDAKNKFVEIDSAREIPYDKLLIATGTEPRPEIEEPRGTCYFWTIDDAEHTKGLLDELEKDKETKKEKKRAVVHGGGFIACEFLNIFKERNLDITAVLRGRHFWNRVFTDQVGEFFTKYLKEQGVKIITGTKIESILGDKELTGIKTDKGEVDCLFLGVAIGTTVDLGWIKEAGIEVGQGIKTNEFLETSVPDVYAAGDVAEAYDPIAERQYLAGNWGRAMGQGRVVAKTMAGERSEFAQVSSYAINVLGLDVTFVGDTNKEVADEVVLRHSEDEQGVTEILIRKDRVVGAAILGRNQDRTPLTKLIENKQDIADIKTKLADPEFGPV